MSLPLFKRVAEILATAHNDTSPPPSATDEQIAQPHLWRVEVNQFSPTADIRTLVRDGDEIIAADLPHYEADRIVSAHNASLQDCEDAVYIAMAKKDASFRPLREVLTDTDAAHEKQKE
jgi:hypothetical protein